MMCPRGTPLGVLLHLGQDIAHNLAILIFSHVGELGPRESMIEGVLPLVALGPAQLVALLYGHQVIGLSTADVHIGPR